MIGNALLIRLPVRVCREWLQEFVSVCFLPLYHAFLKGRMKDLITLILDHCQPFTTYIRTPTA